VRRRGGEADTAPMQAMTPNHRQDRKVAANICDKCGRPFDKRGIATHRRYCNG